VIRAWFDRNALTRAMGLAPDHQLAAGADSRCDQARDVVGVTKPLVVLAPRFKRWPARRSVAR